MLELILPILAITAAWIAFGLLRAREPENEDSVCSSCEESETCSEHFCIREPQ
jgi:hypothetical protein